MTRTRVTIAACTLLLLSATTAVNALARELIQNKGSDTLVNVAQGWAEAYQDVKPDVAVAVSGGGSGTGIAAMINGTVDIANASRKMKDKELRLAHEHGHAPIEHVVGFDALAVFVHPDNPTKTLSIAQLAAIFGRGGEATTWSDLDRSFASCGSDKIVVVSRQNNSGTYAYFRQTVLGKGKYRMGTLDMHGSKDVVDLVEKTPCAIGYSGLAYATDHVHTVCVTDGKKACVKPSVATASDSSYPIARPLFMYTDGEPAGEIKAYMDWIKSDAGQCILRDKGYAPVRPPNCG